ncbi:glycerophosphoryl diester phosphodiesterase [Acetobacter oeni LMG 21952]|nr:glycerophosphodiester phosphodiesterase family protein [Acetobacter oeni]NHO19749.1 glycerophosphodiester phosphodiesterase [Acetobacter oeni]GBR02920.1 glycerophosphoryl diester phosphodiesterase [Acetobacter oeni LMG 21952]
MLSPVGSAFATDLTRRIADPEGGPVVVAHRGCHNAAPWRGLSEASENSFDALDHCVALGVDVMETDVRRTRDGALVMIHDATVDRVTDGHGRVSDLTLAAIGKLHLRENEGGPGAALTNRTIPTLAEMLARAGTKIVLNLDVKDAIYAEVIAAVVEAGAADRVIVKTGAGVNSPSLAGLPPYNRVPFMPILSSGDESGSDLVRIVRQQGSGTRKVVGYEVPRMPAAVLPALAAEARFQHVRLWNNTLWDGFIGTGRGDIEGLRDPDAVWGWLIRSGVSMIQTDEPEALLRFLHRDRAH